MIDNGRYCKRFIVIGMGFQQRQTKPKSNGMVELAAKIRKYLHKQSALYDTLTRVVRWNADCAELAASIEAVAVKSENWTKDNPKYECDVEIYAYSWGCGCMAKKLMKELNKRGIIVRQVIFSDPVYHSLLLNNRWLALLPKWSWFKRKWLCITIPNNVKAVTRFFQNNNVPSGFKLKVSDTYHKEYDLTAKGYKHNDMDNALEFHNEVMALVKIITTERKRNG